MDPVLQYAGLAQQAGRKWDIPAAVLLGLVDVESTGNINAVSPTGAFGLTQFEPGTAATYHVVPGNAESMLEGAAHYLHDLGYSHNPTLALASYNAGPGNPTAAGDYPEKVLAAARNYGSTITAAASSGSASAGAGAPSTTPPTSGANPFDPAGRGSGTALHALVLAALVLAGAALIYLGGTRAAGVKRAPE